MAYWVDELKEAIYKHVTVGTNDYKTALGSTTDFRYLRAMYGNQSDYATFEIISGDDRFNTLNNKHGHEAIVIIRHFYKVEPELGLNTQSLDQLLDKCVEHFRGGGISIDNFTNFDCQVLTVKPTSIIGDYITNSVTFKFWLDEN